MRARFRFVDTFVFGYRIVRFLAAFSIKTQCSHIGLLKLLTYKNSLNACKAAWILMSACQRMQKNIPYLLWATAATSIYKSATLLLRISDFKYFSVMSSPFGVDTAIRWTICDLLSNPILSIMKHGVFTSIKQLPCYQLYCNVIFFQHDGDWVHMLHVRVMCSML